MPGQRRRWQTGPLVRDPSRHINAHNWYARRFAPAVRAAGLDGVTFHTLRKTWASRLGPHISTRVLQILGGWKSLEAVQRYCLPFEEAIRTAMEQASAGGESVTKVSNGGLVPRGKLLQSIEKTSKMPP